MTKQLMTWARSVSGMGKRSGGMEFSSQQALQSYLREHPKADMSKHSVAAPNVQKAQELKAAAEHAKKSAKPGQDVVNQHGEVFRSPEHQRASEAYAAHRETLSPQERSQLMAENMRKASSINRDTPAAREEATAMKKSLQGASKKDVFKLWRGTTQGRLNVANIREQRKSWMIHDIIAARHGKEVAEAV